MKVIVIDIDDHDRVKLSRRRALEELGIEDELAESTQEDEDDLPEDDFGDEDLGDDIGFGDAPSEQPNELLSEVVVAAVVDEAEIAVVTEAAIVEVADAAVTAVVDQRQWRWWRRFPTWRWPWR